MYFDDKKRRRRDTSENDINPSRPVFVSRTEHVVSDLDPGLYLLGAPRGPVTADIFDLTDLYIQSGLVQETATAPADLVIPTMSLDISQHP